MNPMYLDMGMSVIDSVGSYLTGAEQAKLAAATRRYQEKMQALSAAVSYNGITRNEAATVEQNVFADVSVQAAGLQERAEYDVEAAAAGIVGNSVNVGRVQLQGDEARAQTSRKRKFTQQMMSYGDQRKDVSLQRIFSQDITPIQRSNIGNAVFGVASNLIDVWDAHNPSDRQTKLPGG